jgi:hypothetical protein
MHGLIGTLGRLGMVTVVAILMGGCTWLHLLERSPGTMACGRRTSSLIGASRWAASLTFPLPTMRWSSPIAGSPMVLTTCVSEVTSAALKIGVRPAPSHPV